jgi:uncharacterized protein YndB with AHSA1/START domain
MNDATMNESTINDTTINGTTVNVDAAVGSVTLTRTYDASRELVFECMTTPEHLTHFWGPVGVHAPLDRIVVDLRPGGEFTTVMVSDADGQEFTSRGVFVEIDPPSKLVWSEPDVEGGMTTSVSFVALDDGRTRVDIVQTNVPEMYRSPEALEGMTSAFNRFAGYLRTLR